MKMTPDGTVSEFFNTGGIPAGLAFHPDGSLWIADEGKDNHGLIRVAPDGKGEIVVNTYQGASLNGANDLVFDRAGNLYFSDPWGSGADKPIGGFYRLRSDGSLEQLDSGLMFPNGVAIDPSDSALFLAETYRNKIWRYPFNADGSVGPKQAWADTPTPPGPDGMAFNEAGELFVAHFGSSAV